VVDTVYVEAHHKVYRRSSLEAPSEADTTLRALRHPIEPNHGKSVRHKRGGAAEAVTRCTIRSPATVLSSAV
jgi:hypothetical protein